MNNFSKTIMHIWAAILLAAHVGSAFSASKECSKILPIAKKYKIDNLEGYQCGKEIKNPKRFKLNGLKLIAAIEYDVYSSSAYYTGQDVLDGVVSYPDGLGDSFTFQTRSASFNFGSGSDANDLKSIEYPAKYNRDGSYELSTCKSGEMKADAKIKIVFVNDVKSESSREGTWVYGYEIIGVGKYSCRE